MRPALTLLVLLCMTSSVLAQAAPSGAPFVIATGSQLHTDQLFGALPAPLLDRIDAAAKRLSGRIVKLHIVAKDNATVEAMKAEIQRRYEKALPAVTFVVGNLYSTEFSLALDAVIAFDAKTKELPRVEADPLGRILHPGSRVYVSGQAEKPKPDVTATLGTLQSLKRSIEMVGASLQDVVQIKCFLTPISDDQAVRREIEKFFGSLKIPVVMVEWSSTLPIEIELIAACPANEKKSNVEFLTPPGMTASPLYARMTKIDSAQTIYIGGLMASGNDSITGEAEVKAIFSGLSAALSDAHSDLESLVKATYYCANDDTSKALNSLRPNYYNPARPPAASKAIVAGVGFPQRYITIDMIAVPK